MYRRWGKRALDATLATLFLILLSPLLAGLGLLVWIFLGRPILFCQKRPGIHEISFTLFKFRTMKDWSGIDGKPLPDKDRLTRFGRFLRRSSLDELPEFFNVLKGDMSMVGPRPLLMQYLQRYSPDQRRRHDVRPGITGWAQVNGRNALEWEKKFALDVWYVDHGSFFLDMKILFLTLVRIFSREGISQEGHATMEEFRGSLPKAGK